MFAPGLSRNREHKHTYLNVEATREFVVAGVSEKIGPQMVRSAADLPYGESEFEFSNLTPAPAKLVKAPLVLEAPFNLECRLRQIVSLGERPGSGQAIFGDIVAIHVDASYLTPGGDTLDADKLRMVGRLGGTQYCTVSSVWSMEIPPPPSR
jgi:flavin reductase (DIM6/NTAB) family NADH-FMN oxidoreductase RutF